MAIVVGILLAYTLIREAFFLYSHHKLINKLMSRDYHEYKQSEGLYNQKPRAKTPDDEPLEDMGILKDFL